MHITVSGAHAVASASGRYCSRTHGSRSRLSSVRSARRSSSSRAAGRSSSPGSPLIALAEALLAASGPSGVSPARAALGLVGLVGLAAVRGALRPPAGARAAARSSLAAPFRLPLDFGAAHRFYVGLAAGRGDRPPAAALRRRSPQQRSRSRGGSCASERELPAAAARDRRSRSARSSRSPALSVLWSSADAPAQNLLQYFLLPFVVLVAVVARSPFPAWMPRALGIVAVALAALFAAVGLVEEATHRLIFYTPAVQVGNAYSSFFRVTSLFRDPSLYGRHVVLGDRDRARRPRWYRKIGLALAAARDRVPLRRPLLLVLPVEPRRALRRRACSSRVVAGDRAVRLVAAVDRRARARGRRRVRRRQGRRRLDRSA